MKRALVVASVGGFIDFEKDNIHRLETLGYKVDIACATDGWEKYLDSFTQEIINIPFSRNPISRKNIKAYFEIKHLLSKNNYDLVHCHTPVAGMLTRIASKTIRTHSFIIYTAHGFHFYHGAPILNWLIYYPVEWLCSWYTDTLITINSEDYIFAKKKMHAKKIEYVPGIGINVSEIRKDIVDLREKREELIDGNCKMILSVGELNVNKNHKIVLESLAKINDPSLHYFIAGEGELKESLIEMAKKLSIDKQVHLLGYRNDIIDLLKCVDLFCFPSFREGLSVALMEAIACGTPVLCSDIRGNRDLAEGNSNILLFNPLDDDDCSKKIVQALCLERKEGDSIYKFSQDEVNIKMKNIYARIDKKG